MENFSINGVLLYTESGVRLITSENGFLTAEDCCRKCNSGKDDFTNNIRANALCIKSIMLDRWKFKDKDWYKDRDNFKSYHGELKRK